MEPRVALAAAIACGVVAVGIVSADLAYSLTANLQTQASDGSWRTLVRSESDNYSRGFPGDRCGGPRLRLHVDNHKPIPDNPRLSLAYQDVSGQTHYILEETWRLGAFAARDYEFTVPDSAFRTNLTSAPTRAEVGVYADVGDSIHLYTCVTEEAS